MNDSDLEKLGPQCVAICMGFDALAIATGHKPSHFTADEVTRWLRLMSPAAALLGKE